MSRMILIIKKFNAVNSRNQETKTPLRLRTSLMRVAWPRQAEVHVIKSHTEPHTLQKKQIIARQIIKR